MTASRKTISFILSVAFTILISCDDDINFGKNCINGQGSIITQDLTLSDFDAITLSIAGNVIVSQGMTQEVRVIGRPNIIEKLKTTVSNSVWTISLENGCYNNDELTIEIVVPDINLLTINGSGSITVNDFTNQNALGIEINGSGNVTLNEFEGITNLEVILRGSGRFKANEDIATLDNLTINNSGSGQYLGFQMASNNCTITSSGSGKSELTAVSTLNATLNGSGNVFYKGTPDITQNIAGSENLINAN